MSPDLYTAILFFVSLALVIKGILEYAKNIQHIKTLTPEQKEEYKKESLEQNKYKWFSFFLFVLPTIIFIFNLEILPLYKIILSYIVTQIIIYITDWVVIRYFDKEKN